MFVGAWIESQNFYTVISGLRQDSGGILTNLMCDDGPEQTVRFHADAGATYLVMVTADARSQNDFDDSGGDFALNVEVPPPPIEMHVDVDPNGVVLDGGSAVLVSGSFSCSAVHALYAFHVAVHQGGANADGFVDLACSTDEQRWVHEWLRSATGLFGAGTARVTVLARVCADVAIHNEDGRPYYCNHVSLDQSVALGDFLKTPEPTPPVTPPITDSSPAVTASP